MAVRAGEKPNPTEEAARRPPASERLAAVGGPWTAAEVPQQHCEQTLSWFLKPDAVLVFMSPPKQSRAVVVGGPVGPRSLGRRKFSKCAALVGNCQQAGRRARFLPVEVGRRGICGPLSGRSLHYFRRQRREKRKGEPSAALLKRQRAPQDGCGSGEEASGHKRGLINPSWITWRKGYDVKRPENAWWFLEYERERLRQWMCVHTFQTSLHCRTCSYLVILDCIILKSWWWLWYSPPVAVFILIIIVCVFFFWIFTLFCDLALWKVFTPFIYLHQHKNNSCFFFCQEKNTPKINSYLTFACLK